MPSVGGSSGDGGAGREEEAKAERAEGERVD